MHINSHLSNPDFISPNYRLKIPLGKGFAYIPFLQENPDFEDQQRLTRKYQPFEKLI